jgi:hypothetical protein
MTWLFDVARDKVLYKAGPSASGRGGLVEAYKWRWISCKRAVCYAVLDLISLSRLRRLLQGRVLPLEEEEATNKTAERRRRKRQRRRGR